MKNHTPRNPDELRRQAEERLNEREGGQRSTEEMAQTLHELRVHQIELEMQNEQLRTAQAKIEAGRTRYYDLYDLAPVGYCTVSEKGLILEANLTAATLLGTTRGALVNQPISRFILKDDQDIYYLLRKKLFEAGEPQECELRLVKPDGAFIWAHLTATAAQAEDGTPVCRVALTDISERKQAEEALCESEKKYRDLVEGLNDAVYRMTLPDGRYEYFSSSAEEVFGYSSEEFINNPLLIQSIMHPDSAGYFENKWKELLEGKVQETFEYKIIDPEGNERWIVQSNKATFDDSGKIKTIEGLCRNITERKQSETYHELGREVLQILNEPGDLQQSIQRVLTTLKTRTGFDAVGLRLQEGEDFPYFAQDGFSKDFLRTENRLVERGKDGGVCRDENGNVSLECTCGLVISGKTDPSNPLFTKGGSCWTNDSFPLLDLPSDQDPRMHPRNNCIHQGYASVALIPVRVQDQMHSRDICIRHGFNSMAQVPVRASDRIVGLIQLNDKRKGRFTLETIQILEGIAAHIGSALMRKQAEEQLQLNLRFQEIVSQISSRFVTASQESFDDDINDMLSRLGRHFQVNRSYLILFSEEYETMINTHEWCSEGVAPMRTRIQNQPIDTFSWWKERILSGQTVHVPDVNRLPDEASAIKEEFKAQDIKSLINIPVKSADRIRGFIGFDAVKKKYRWNEDEINDLTVAANTAGDLLEKLENERKLIEAKQEAEEAQDEIEKSWRMTQSTIDSLNANICVLDERGNIISVNGSWREFAQANGATPAKTCEGTNYLEVCESARGEDRVMALEFAEGIRGVKSGKTDCFESEYPCHSPDQKRWFNGSVTPIRDRENGLNRVVIAHMDITERKRLTNDLIRAEKLASVGELVAGVAHEIKNPLNTMLGFTELLLLQKELEDALRKDIQRIHDAAGRVNTITDGLLDFAKEYKQEKTEVNLNEVLRETLNLKRYHLESKNIKSEEIFDPELPPVIASKGQMEQVFMNIINNAEYFIDEKKEGGTLTLRTSQTGSGVKIEILDTGPGIPEDALDDLFSPFFTGKPEGEGTGLGLSVSYGIVKEHGGHIEAANRSEVEGAVFTIYLPLKA